MKKSQILAALALAFALGVVAPVSSATYAKVGGDSATAETITDEVQAAIDAATALEDYKEYCNSVTGLIKTVTGVESAIEEAFTSAFDALQTSLTNYSSADKVEGVTELGFNPSAYTSYTTLKAVVENKIKDMTDALVEHEDKNADIQEAIDELDGAVSEAQEIIDQAYNDQTEVLVNDLRGRKMISDGEFDSVSYTVADYNKAIAIAKANPYDSYVALCAAVNTAKKVVNPSGKTYEPSAARSAATNIYSIIAAINNGTDTPSLAPVEPSDTEDEDGKGSADAPNSGALANADATAKATVSIMAAIASVATAAFVAIRKIAASKKA